MKKLALLSVVLLGLVFVNNAQAATPARDISKGTLTAMGLQGMQPMSDAEGLSVRGKGANIFININVQTVIIGSHNTVINVVGNIVGGGIHIHH